LVQITPQASQELLDELESSKQSRLRAWAVLQEFRTVLTDLGGVNLKAPSKKTFDAEGTILREALVDCLRERHAALAQLADAARRVDRSAFGSRADFPQAHQALLKALDRAEALLQALWPRFMNVLFAILGALLSGSIAGAAVFVLSKRENQSDISEELFKLQRELDLVRSHAAKIQRKIEEEQTVNARAHLWFPSGTG
jgi:hypothetical protein